MEKNILNTIISGDSVEEMKKLPNESFDFIFADPPYFMQTEGELLRVGGQKFSGVDDDWDKFNSFKEYDDFSIKWLNECKRILKKDGTICVIGSFQNIYRLGYFMQNLDFWILNDIIWHKSNPVPNFAGTRFCNAHETMIWASKSKKSKFTFNYKTMKHLNNNKQEKSVWEIPLCTGNERLKDAAGKKLHSTQKPEALLEKIILASTKPNNIVFDPFFGTGTTGAVAKKLGRNFVGIEREQKYIEAAQKRLDEVEAELNDINQLTLEKKPPKVSMQELIHKGYLKIKQELFSKNKEFQCFVLENGHVSDDENELSIHKMSAKKLNKINHNGWDYFYVYYKDEFIPLNDLRFVYESDNRNE
ncbi:DNA-methyltransferase [Mycoplasma nasistruthionis]|uniref:Methyltransferase n=1 Tax=Mycoplasma nasistruthionis TaxID=353852 RepID=A0A4Y6I7I2_9MOLU|nr:site-specific DNA-methyltransferase [Mycoplasma nasistruthionis]QDF65159.1 site-specific DNA-methyltransferase [Mycoplasma nasistruthionis]